MQPQARSTDEPPRTLSRSRAERLIAWVIVVATGFLAGMHFRAPGHDLNYVVVGGTLIIGALVAMVLLQRRASTAAMRAVQARNEELSDRIWELREAEERARSLLEAHGDIIVRRDSIGRSLTRMMRFARSQANRVRP